jgi:hypothetical protein
VKVVRSATVLALVLVGALALASTASARDPRLVPVKASQTGFGAFEENFSAPSPPALTAAFGQPEAVTRPTSLSCQFAWPSLGIFNVELAAFGTVTDACANGTFQSAVLTDPSWHTGSGIHPGGPAKAAKKRAVAKCTVQVSCQGGGYVLGTHHSDCAAAKVANVVARIRGGRVRSLEVFSHGCE